MQLFEFFDPIFQFKFIDISVRRIVSGDVLEGYIFFYVKKIERVSTRGILIFPEPGCELNVITGFPLKCFPAPVGAV